MAVVIARSILKTEFGRVGLTADDEAVLRRTAKSAHAVFIRGEGLPPETRLVKVYGTAPGGARRVVYLAQTSDDDLLLLFFRSKNDAVGKNVTLENPVFKKALKKHLGMLKQDLENGNYEILE